jgi:hypothetical protein
VFILHMQINSINGKVIVVMFKIKIIDVDSMTLFFEIITSLRWSNQIFY